MVDTNKYLYMYSQSQEGLVSSPCLGVSRGDKGELVTSQRRQEKTRQEREVGNRQNINSS